MKWSDDRLIEKDLEGGGPGLIELPSWNFPEETEENHKNLHDKIQAEYLPNVRVLGISTMPTHSI
jgi:hypothetical protein